MRKLFDAQFEKTEDGKIVERKPTPPPKICVQDQIAKHKSLSMALAKQASKMLFEDIREAHTPDELLAPVITFTPYRAMNVGADEITLKGLNKTEWRYLEILKTRPEYVWIGVKMHIFRPAGNTHYTPDFQTLDKDGLFTMIDVKGGFTREDSQLKMKIAARMLPMYRWVKAELILATRKHAESLKETIFKG